MSLLLGWLGLSRYVFGGEPLFAFTNMAVHTASLFLLLSAGTLTLRQDAGVARCWRAKASAAAWRARLLPAAILVPLLAGALTLHFERRGTLGIEAAVSIFALSSVIVFVAFVLVNAARGERADALRRAAERALRLSRGAQPAHRRNRARWRDHDQRRGHHHRLEYPGRKDVRLDARRSDGPRARRR